MRATTTGGWVIMVTSLTALTAASCSGDDRRSLVIYSPHGRDLLAFYEAAFEAEHPGVDVQYVDMGSQEILDRIRSERANPQADVWWGAPSEIFERGAEEGLLDSYAPTWIEAVPEAARDPDGRWVGTFLTPQVIAYNSELVDPVDAPADWDDVLQPQWRDRVLIRDPLASGTMRAIFRAVMDREYRRSGGFEEGYEWLLRLDAQTKEYVLNPTLLYQKLARGEGLVTLWNMPDIETLRATTTMPIAYVIPAGGTPVVIDGIAVVAGSRDPTLAREFVEFVGGREAVTQAAEHFFRIPARTDIPTVALPSWLGEALPEITPMPIDAELARERAPEWLQYWDREIRGRGRDAGF